MTTASQLLRLNILFSHLTAERSILWAPQGLRPMRYSLQTPASSAFVLFCRRLLDLALPERRQMPLLLLSVSARVPYPAAWRTSPQSCEEAL